MSGIVALHDLLASMAPVLRQERFVFVSFPTSSYGAHAELDPVAAIVEAEGLTLVVSRDRANAAGLAFDGVFRMITLGVQSSLAAVGLTAKVGAALTERGISANVIAGFHHDHVFVPDERAHDAMLALQALADAV
jgi:uncharacterized protein